MPIGAESFDFVTCTAAFKNFPDPVVALDEIQRVLRPGGHASILDLRVAREAIDQEVREMQQSPPSASITTWIFRS
jgi:ubiquinone/menaquinone biosynthesis C-methylase UbiE